MASTTTSTMKPTCHAMLVKSRGIPCRCLAKHMYDNHYYCGRHIQKMKNREFKTLSATQTKECPICLEPIDNSSGLAGPCNHLFHLNCYLEYKRNGGTQCPVCERCILYDGQDDAIAKTFKQDAFRYAGFQVWCIQKKMGKRLIVSPERNKDYCTHAHLSLSLNREMKKVATWSPDVLFDKLMKLCRDFPNVLN